MTQFEVIIPTEWGKEFFEKVKKIFESQSKEWAFALHPVDELSSFEHWHIGGKLHSSRTLSDILSWFTGLDRIQSNSIEKIKSHWKTYLCYILHKTKDAILQGKSLPIEYGGNADFDKALNDYTEIGQFDTLISDIVNGKIREYDFYGNTELCAQIIKRGFYNKVKQAFETYTKDALVKSSTRVEERKQCWIFGKAGSGKTELAKHICRENGYADKDIFITSSGSNPFDDYRGQPCVIVDDIDSETMSPKTMLKLADCFTGSAVKARYSNKVILANIVVFTSTIAPQTWWTSLAEERTDGNVYQLLRRLNLGSWHIDGENVQCCLYDGTGKVSNTVQVKLPDAVLDKVLNGSLQVQNALDFLNKFFEVKAFDNKGNSLNLKVNPQTGDFNGSYHTADDF